jgi:hypothetical protein
MALPRRSRRIDEVIQNFKDHFGERGGEKPLSNVGKGRNVLQVCRELMSVEQSLFFEYFQAWHDLDYPEKRTPGDSAGGLLHCALTLAQMGQWEGAWALLQAHVDQTQKEEVIKQSRRHKGDPLCGLAILGQELGSHSLARHYAQLSSAGDIYWQHELPELAFGGLGPTILEQYESRTEHDKWRADISDWLAPLNENGYEPVYLETFLAARWFGEAYSKRFLDLARVRDNKGKPFVEVLLDAVEKPGNVSDAVTGTRFEAATGLLLSATPGFDVRSARQTTDEQVDLVVRYQPDRLARLSLPPGPGLVECKWRRGNGKDKLVSVSDLRSFAQTCQFHRVGFGILATRAGISGSGREDTKEPIQAELVRRRLLVDGLTVLVLRLSDLRGKSHDLRGLQDVLADNQDRLVFGPIAGESS